MRGFKIPKIVRSPLDKSITLSYQQSKYSLIWLHGLCDEPQSFTSFFTHSDSPLYRGMRVKLIQAPIRNVTLNNNTPCNSWYDLRSLNRFTMNQNQVFNLDQLDQSKAILEAHVEEEIKRWTRINSEHPIAPNHRVFVGGFSQGGVVALHYGLSAKLIPAGVIACSSYLLKYTKLTNLRKLPISLIHGTRDSVIREIEAKNSFKKILEDEHLVEYTAIPKLDHTMALEQLNIIHKWYDDTTKTLQKHYVVVGKQKWDEDDKESQENQTKNQEPKGKQSEEKAKT